MPTEEIHEGSEPEETATATPTALVRAPGMAPKREDVLPEPEGVKYGLIHLVPMAVGTRVPASLPQLDYSVVLVEAGEVEAENGVHSLVARLLTGKPELVVALVGEVMNCGEALNGIQRSMTRQDLKTYTIRMYWPNNAETPWTFGELQLLLVTRTELTWRV